MRLLIDTNVFLEIILDQQSADEAKELLANTRDHEFFMSDYSLHSIGLLLFRRRQHDVFQKFVEDITFGLGITLTSVPLAGWIPSPTCLRSLTWTLTTLTNTRPRRKIILPLSASTQISTGHPNAERLPLRS